MFIDGNLGSQLKSKWGVQIDTCIIEDYILMDFIYAH